ncbi:unnamed protein product [Durusdinium trenchii]|uniref:Uncharacterized protein n=1 Tax=Durusdinium trenchii TaxID=1381693 RepID=A0ABP0MS78_9DINO
METTPLTQDLTAEEDEPSSAQRSHLAWRLLALVPLAIIAALISRGTTSFTSALRLRGLSKTLGLFVPTSSDEGNGMLPMNNPDEEQNPFLHPASKPPDPGFIPLPVLHRGYDCWQPCLGAGTCTEFCGPGNACCRKGAENDPPECAKITDFWTNHHECVRPVVKVEDHHFGQDCWERCQIGGDCAWCGGGQACCRKNSTLDPPECHGVVDWPTDRHHTCVTPMNDVPVKHEGQDCWEFCEGKGNCNWCGLGNACCRYGDEFTPPECRAVIYYSSKEHHVCVKPSFPRPMTLPGRPRVKEKECRPGLVMGPFGCLPASKPQLVTFYAYRLGDGSWTNANLGSIGAVMYSLHTKILGCPRYHGIDRIHRLKVTMKNTEEMFRQQHHEFGPLHHFRNGQCVSSFCNQTFQQFGYTVGCAETSTGGSYPSQSHSAWYSLPGPCPNLPNEQKTETCKRDLAGGECAEPTGSLNCTFHLEYAGNVSLDELSGRNTSTSLKDWCAAGHVEYDPSTDRGVGMDFWNGLTNGSRGKERMYKLSYLFWKKYPNFPKLLPEPCTRRTR